MTSRPLFASVAESIVIFAPMLQVGWRRACCGVIAANSAAGRSRNGPPDAVRIEARPPCEVLADEALPDRRMLRVDRAQPAERAGEGVGRARRATLGRARPGERHHEVPAGDEGLLVGGGDDLAGLERREHRPQADDAARADDDHVHVVARRQLEQRVVAGADDDIGAGTTAAARRRRRRPR